MAEAMDIDAGPGPSGKAAGAAGPGSKGYDLPWVRAVFCCLLLYAKGVRQSSIAFALKRCKP